MSIKELMTLKGIRGKIVLAFLMMIAIVLIGFGIIYFQVNNSEKILTNLYANKNSTVVDLENLRDAVDNSKILTFFWVFARDSDGIEEKKATLKALVDTETPGSEIKKLTNNLHAASWSENDKATLTNTMSNLDSLIADEKQITQLFTTIDDYNDFGKWMEKDALLNRIGSLSEKTLTGLDALIAYKTTETAESQIIGNFQKISFTIIFISILAVLVAFLASFITTKQIAKPISAANNAIRSIANGNLNINVNSRSKDEIGQMIVYLKEMAEKLKNVITFVVTVSDNISAASHQLKSSSTSMSEGATQQAASAEEVASSMEEMSANIQQNNDNAQQTEKIALKAAQEVEKGSTVVNNTVDSMQTIAKKITIIGEIARQTNLLALNAAVEAARAGEHGRGFAVVAAEVRKLAERSHEAAQEIDQLTDSSVGIAIESGEMLNEVVPNIQRTAQLVQEISAASMEQSSGADQVNNAIQHLNQIVQQNAASSEEMAASAEELSSQATELKQVIAYFKIDHNEEQQNELDSNAIEGQEISSDENTEDVFTMPTDNSELGETEEIQEFEEEDASNVQNEDGGVDLNLDGDDDLDREYEKF